MSDSQNITIRPATQPLVGEITVPPDKSISHRALMFAALASGQSHLQNLLASEDVKSTYCCLEKLGVTMTPQDPQNPFAALTVQGVGLHGLKPPQSVLDCGNSGTTMRLLLGMLAGLPFASSVTGDASLSRRPMQRVTDPLTQMGACFQVEGEGTDQRVIHVQGRHPLEHLDYKLPMASAQVKSSLLLAGLTGAIDVTLIEPAASRDHSERMLKALGVKIEIKNNILNQFSSNKISSFNLDIPGDFSSAAFWIVAASLVPGSKLLIKNVGVNPTRLGLFAVLKKMGARMERLNERTQGGEPIADLRVEHARLAAGQVSEADMGLLIDEIPILAMAFVGAQGRSQVKGARELRFKESDRLQGVCQGLKALGIQVHEHDDGFDLAGPQKPAGGVVDSLDDHRLAMAFAILALVAEKPVTIKHADCVRISYPRFWQDLAQLTA